MKNERAHKLLLKIVRNSASIEEISEIKELVTDKEIKSEMIDLLRADHLVDREFQSFDVEDSFAKFLKEIEKKTTIQLNVRRRKRRILLRYAAVFVGIVGLSYLFILNSGSDSISITLKEDAITLQLDNGDKQVISEQGEQIIVNANGVVVGNKKEGKLIYKNEKKAEKLVYNELYVPYGKKFQLLLSDGTHVHLNSGSSLKYPVNFIAGKERKVFLKGEAFFDVARDEENTFVVNSNDVNIQVLGTKFNVSSYPEDDIIKTVLTEGSIKVQGINNAESFTKISPGEMATWNKNKKKMSVFEVDVLLHTGWKEGILIFKHMKFEQIKLKLERHYNFKITNNRPMLNERYLTARFENETIEHVLKSLEKMYEIDFSVENNEVIIN